MEQHYDAPIARVFALLINPEWLEARSHAWGELSASIKVRRKTGGGATLTMKRRVRRDLSGVLAKVMPREADLLFDETWTAERDGGRTGTLSMDVVGQRVKMKAEFELYPTVKDCV